ncbi:MAG TPA: vitamin K epoxide reductase family protein [Methylomirabilota bacterium]|nr:vitamin K epoxide reductase family protein [Methylomirabilota bacterium]
MKPTPRDGILRGGRAAIIRLLIAAAAGISAYLLSVSLSGGSAVGCGPGSACDEVLQSRWAYVLGVPVSALALVVDLALLLTTFGCGSKSSAKQRRAAWEIIIPCSILILGAALWFMALQAFVLHRFCPWCSVAHACGAVAAILLLMRVPVTDSRERREKDPAVQRSSMIKLAIAAGFAIALLGVAQVAAPRKSYSVTTVPERSPVNTLSQNIQRNPIPNAMPGPATNMAGANAMAAAVSNAANAALSNAPKRTLESFGFLQILGGRVVLDLNKVPIWGPANAPAKLVSLYDYTCHHCRDMHPHVADLRRTFGDKIAIISLPMPLDSQCNSLVRQTPRAHGSACTYAKLGLIVWKAKRAAIEPFDDWVFSFPNPPPLTEVTNKAIALVGLMAFDIASRDPWIEEQLKTNVGIYGITAKEFNKGAMPQFIIGSNIVSGILNAGQFRQFVAPYVEAAQ